MTSVLIYVGAAIARFAGRSDLWTWKRLAGAWRSTYGMLDSRFDAVQILDLLCPDTE
jgi:hypothetical protein